MALQDIFGFLKRKRKSTPEAELTRKDIEDEIRHAWWDLFVSNLPRPVVIDTVKDKKGTPEIFADGVPSGFCIDPVTWITYFNKNDIPPFALIDDSRKYCRSTGQHETAHFTVCPGSKRMDVRLVDAALKGFTRLGSDQKTGVQAARLVENFFGDWVGDYMLGVGKYGREDFGEMTKWRLRTTVDDVAKRANNQFSPLWKVLVGTYEKMFNDDLGMKKYTSLDQYEKDIVEKCTYIMGNDFQNDLTWPEKVEKLASVLEDVILKSSQQQKGKGKKGQGQGQGGGLSIPEDVERQMGPRPKGSQVQKVPKKGEGKEEYQKKEKDKGNEKGGLEKEIGKGDEDKPMKIDDEVLDEAYKLNKDNPERFAGLMGAFAPVDADDCIRLMYRARAKEYLIKITEKRDKGSYTTLSSLKSWNIGDPIAGRGGLEIMPSVMTNGRMIPGLTTVKRRREINDLPGRFKQIADILIIIDSSGSLIWVPMANDVESRGGFDQEIIAAEAATLYALDHGGKVGVINFSGQDEKTGERQVIYQDFTNNIDKIEKTIMRHYNDGTLFPCEEFESLMKKTKNRVATCIFSDFAIYNFSDFAQSISRHVNKTNPVYLFATGGNVPIGNGENKIPPAEGLVGFPVRVLDDLKGVVIGQVKDLYKKN